MTKSEEEMVRAIIPSGMNKTNSNEFQVTIFQINFKVNNFEAFFRKPTHFYIFQVYIC